jgi:hypothetical protein
MTVNELIHELKKHDGNLEVVLLDPERRYGSVASVEHETDPVDHDKQNVVISMP